MTTHYLITVGFLNGYKQIGNQETQVIDIHPARWFLEHPHSILLYWDAIPEPDFILLQNDERTRKRDRQRAKRAVQDEKKAVAEEKTVTGKKKLFGLF